MSQSLVIIHERVGRWAGQLRPRFHGSPVRWSETRSTLSLVQASRMTACPILVIDLEGRSARGLEGLAGAIEVAPSALALVLNPSNRPEVASLARELGATIVLGGVVVPPVVESLIRRWIPLSLERSERHGWSPGIEPPPEPWDRNNLFGNVLPPRPR